MTHSPIPRATFASHPNVPPPTFVAVTESGDIVVAETATGQIVRTVVIRDQIHGAVDSLSVAPKGKTLYFATSVGQEDCAVWSVPLAGGTRERIATGLSPAVSPDGRWLAFLVLPGCGTPDTTVIVRDLQTGKERSWKDADELPVDGIIDWAPDSRILYLLQCGADTCGPVGMDTGQSGSTLRKFEQGPKADELDGRLFGWAATVTRRDRLVTIVDYGDAGPDERYPMIEIDPVSGRIMGSFYDDAQKFIPYDFDASGEHLLIRQGETLHRWVGGNLTRLGTGFLDVRWIE